ncbi:MAG: HEAT repeat domain-containing protein [Desulfobulbaceae bacterium]|nr:HEAT repeat domain-containing protein [Desulfobulbaceae bacterium]
MENKTAEVSDKELQSVIADFLDMGHVDNIVAMFCHDPLYYSWVGEILRDERFSVRLGLSVLFEELRTNEKALMYLAIPSLKEVLQDDEPLYRGEALSLLGTIGTAEAYELIRSHLTDNDFQVREMAELLMEEAE